MNKQSLIKKMVGPQKAGMMTSQMPGAQNAAGVKAPRIQRHGLTGNSRPGLMSGLDTGAMVGG